MSEGPPDATILGYIRDNRGTYTREAIRRALLEAGHTEAAIDAAWAAIEREETPAVFEPLPPIGPAPLARAAAPPGASPGAVRQALRTLAFWATLFGFLVGYIALSALLAATANDQTSGIVGLTILFLPLLGLVAGVAFSFPERTRPIGFGLIGALVVLVGLLLLLSLLAFIAVVILFGICVVALSQGTTP